MSVSLESVNTADLESIGVNDFEPSDVVNPPLPNPEDVEKNVQQLLESISCSVKTERPEIALGALVNVQSIVQRKINSLVEQMDSGSHKDDGAEGLKASPSLQDVPKVPEPTDLQEEDASSHTSGDDDASQSSDPGTSESSSEESDSTGDSESTLPEAIYDKADGVYRCGNIGCGWEVAFGYCHGCQTKYVIEDDESEAVDPTNSLTVFTRGILVSGGDSPSPETIPSYLRPSKYKQNPRMFEELVSRGATLVFCETWYAIFREDHGIVVQANDRLKEIYGSFLGEWDSWSIWIGRRIKLGEDDPEGIMYMEDLLDLIFTEDDDELWITYKEKECQSHWVTRPKGGPRVTGVEEVAEVADEYDEWSGEDDDGESCVGSYAGESSASEAQSTSDPETSDCESTWWSDDSENEAEGEVQADFQDVGQATDAVEGNENEPRS